MKKIIALAVAAVMVGGMLASCGDKSTETSGTASSGGSSVGTSSGTGEAETDFTYIHEYVDSLAEEHKYNGATFTLVGRGMGDDQDGNYNRNGAFPAVEEYNGVLENDALWDRQRTLEQKFNIDIVTQKMERGEYDGPGTPTALLVIDHITAGLNDIDLVDGNLNVCGRTMLEKNVLMEVGELEGIDLSRDWWLNDIYDQLSIGGNLYFLSGKICSTYYNDTTCILFNKDVAKDYNIEEPYEIVKSGEWTFDKMNELAQSIPSGGDVYRYMIRWSGGLSFFFSGGYSLTEKNANDVPEIPKALPNDAVDYISKLGDVFGDTTTTYNYLKPGDFSAANWTEMTTIEEMFPGNRVLFWIDHTSSVPDMREYDVEFGILPLPKKDASQKDYISYTDSGTVSGFYVPALVRDAEMIGYVVEAMAALSEEYLEPAYYERSLRTRGTFDIESRDMLDILYKTKKLDIADIYKFGDVAELIDNNCNGSREDLASGYTVTARLAATSVKQLLNTLGVKVN